MKSRTILDTNDIIKYKYKKGEADEGRIYKIIKINQ